MTEDMADVAHAAVVDEPGSPVALSVVIPTYNRAKRIQACLNSVVQAGLDGLEVVVVDDGSTDDTQDVMQAFAGMVRYVRQPNGGPSAARNTGIREAKGRYIAFLDSDDGFVPGVRQRIAEFMDAHPDVALAFTDATVNLPDGTSSRAFRRGGLEWFWRIPYTPGPGGVRVFDRAAFFRAMVLDRCYMVPSITIVRRSAFETAGLFDEKIRGYEEWDVFTRVAAQFPCAYVDEPGAIIEKHESNLSGDVEAMIVQGVVILQKFLDGGVPLTEELKRETTEKLQRMTFDAAYHAFVREDHPTARRRLREYMKRWGVKRRALTLWGATWLPPGQVRGLRALKARLASSR